MQPRRLVVRFADIDHRGEVAVLLVLEVLRPSGRPLDDGLDLSVLQLELLDPSGSGGFDPLERLVFVVDNEIDATFGNLCLHRFVALLVNIELPLRADDVAQGEDGDRLRGSLKLHIAALEDEKLIHFCCVLLRFLPEPCSKAVSTRANAPISLLPGSRPLRSSAALRPSAGLSAAYTPVRSFSLFWYAFTSGSG